MAAPTELRQRLLPLVGTWVGTVPQPWVHSDRVKLTPRELEILGALRVHRTIKEVATDLHVSPNTAKTHVRTLYRKLGVHSREDALRSGRDLEM
nr:helix-turn-helix transcriptional regulator [Plantibacter sp. VKM Ac-2885]